MRDVQNAGGLLHALVDLRLGEPAQLEREGHVLVDGHVRIERVVLEDHRDIAIFRHDVVHDAFADLDGSFGDFFESGDHSECGAFATTGRTDKDDELAVCDVDVHAFDGADVAGIDFADALKNDLCHGPGVPFLLR